MLGCRHELFGLKSDVATDEFRPAIFTSFGFWIHDANADSYRRENHETSSTTSAHGPFLDFRWILRRGGARSLIGACVAGICKNGCCSRGGSQTKYTNR